MRRPLSRPVTVPLETITSRLKAPLLTTAAISRRIRLPIAEFPVMKRRRRTLIPVETLRTIRSAPLVIRTRRIRIFVSRPKSFALTGIGLAGTRIGLLVRGFGGFGSAGIGALLALALAGETALGEFLLRPPRYPGTALAGRGPIAPAAAIVVFIVIAGHEWAHFGYS